MQPGLTLVVGPPGTGKTDVAVQIISNLYHNHPNQRTLIVTHSNQALNQLFEKIMALDIDERHLLRLGHGEEALETEKDFSRLVKKLLCKQAVNWKTFIQRWSSILFLKIDFDSISVSMSIFILTDKYSQVWSSELCSSETFGSSKPSAETTRVFKCLWRCIVHM